MALELVYTKTYDATFQGEYWRGTCSWYGLPTPLDFLWIADSVIAYNVTTRGGTMMQVRIYREEVYNLFGFPVLYRYVMEYDHHIVIPAIATAILYVIAAALVVIGIYFAYQGLQLLFVGYPDKYQPATPGNCRDGYVWDQATGYCLRVSPPPPDWTKIAYAVVAVTGAIAVVQIIRYARR